MKLYTINATPKRTYTQLTDELKSDIRRKYITLKGINERSFNFYPDDVAEVLSVHGIDGFTIYPVTGYWKGEQEKSFKIEIATDDKVAIGKIAMTLRELYNQDAVMVTSPDNTVDFI